MNTLIEIKKSTFNSASTQTMSSIEIAEVCGKQHKNVMRDIKQIFSELKFEPAKFLSNYIDEQGKKRPCYHLPKRECLILVSGYSTALRAKIIDRWQELERQISAPQIDYSKPEALLGVLNHLQSQIEQKDHAIAELK
ncbi:Rha family transcriptional regulator, partial [Bartonella queenslandensis]|uniref:Rha family transcriptional regulator n=1 Tax=Bartonella queenslandensis TaxID=481138 RepID=UPI00058496AD